MTEGPLLLVDGSCSFCAAAARWCQAGQEVEVLDGGRLAPGALASLRTSEQQVARELVLVEDGQTLGGSAAVARLLVLRGGAWSLVGRAMSSRLISPLAGLVYRAVARLRHHLPGRARDGQGRLEASGGR